ncbi:MAG: hypothetical protein ABSE82_07310, partial [Nitrososphaerales archaeon]
ISKKAGISNLIGALLLIVITLGIAGGVAAYSFGLFGSSSTNLSATITTASATYTSGGTIITLSVKNTGTMSFTIAAIGSIAIDGAACTTTTCAATITWSPATALPAGQSESTTFTDLTTLTQGSSHVISITVTATSGGTYVTPSQSFVVQ